MNREAFQCREAVGQYEKDLKNAKERLERLERTCLHVWSEPIRDDIYKAGYTIPADPEGTMGIDWRPAFHVPSETTKRWKRCCSECGKTEHTTSIQTQTTERPRF